MNINKIIQRVKEPEPWSEGEKIPWNDPEFSARMLEHHLSQDHDLASRRFEIIDRHVEWINKWLGGKPSKILDLACGPGFYSNRLTRLGHNCTGVDFGPASIKYAKEKAAEAGLDVEFVLDDIRTVDYGAGNDLVMFVYGEFNVFKKTDIKAILEKAYASHKPGGLIIAEPNKYETVKREGLNPASWYSSLGGLFSPVPHLCLMENYWYPEKHIATNRYYIVDGATSEVTLHGSSMQAYTRSDYVELFTGAGFRDIEFFDSLSGRGLDVDENLEVIVAKK